MSEALSVCLPVSWKLCVIIMCAPAGKKGRLTKKRKLPVQ